MIVMLNDGTRQYVNDNLVAVVTRTTNKLMTTVYEVQMSSGLNFQTTDEQLRKFFE